MPVEAIKQIARAEEDAAARKRQAAERARETIAALQVNLRALLEQRRSAAQGRAQVYLEEQQQEIQARTRAREELDERALKELSARASVHEQDAVRAVVERIVNG